MPADHSHIYVYRHIRILYRHLAGTSSSTAACSPNLDKGLLLLFGFPSELVVSWHAVSDS